MEIDGNEAYDSLYKQIRERQHKYPEKKGRGSITLIDSALAEFELLVPRISPKFKILPEAKIFTIGSCFAREIEKILIQSNYKIPEFDISDTSEFPHPPRDMLNLYNAGSISDTIERALGLKKKLESSSAGIEIVGEELFRDLMIHKDAKPLKGDAFKLRRAAVDSLYDNLLNSDVLIVTLGLVESWIDKIDNTYLNVAPSKKWVSQNPNRYVLEIMHVEECFSKLKKAFQLIKEMNPGILIMVTVSPIPLEVTFSGENIISQTYLSKSILRVVAENLRSELEYCDYFPSFEMVMSGGTSSFTNDNVHVKPEVVDRVTSTMLSVYGGNYDANDESPGDLLESAIVHLQDVFILDVSRSVALCKKLTESFPASWEANYLYSEFLLRAGKINDAQHYATLAFRKNPAINDKLNLRSRLRLS